MWAEKAGPLETDVRVPLAIRGPGIAPGSSTTALTTNLDIAPTLLELAGVPNAWPSSSALRDGRSLVPVLLPSGRSGAGAAAAAWGRDRLLLEFVGWPTYEWLAPCTFGLAGDGPCGPASPAGLVNAASNNWVALRVVNATHDFVFAEYRAPLAPLSPASTNWTEAYDVRADPFQVRNLAAPGQPGGLTPAEAAA